MNAEKSYTAPTGSFAGLRYKRLRLPVTSPACYSPSRKTIYINPPSFDRLSKRAQDFVMCHEAGHASTKSETGADWYGFNRFIGMGYTPKDAIEAMNESLSMSTPEQQRRFLELIYKAAVYDKRKNNNAKTLKIIMNNPTFEQFTPEDARLLAMRAGVSEDEAADFLGMSESRKAKKEQRQANRQAKKDAKLARKEAKNQVILSRAAKNNAKAQGIADGTYDPSAGIKSVFSGITDTVKGVMGIGSTDTTTDVDYSDAGIDYSSTETKSSTSSNLKWILIAAAVVIAIVVVVIIIKKRKK